MTLGLWWLKKPWKPVLGFLPLGWCFRGGHQGCCNHDWIDCWNVNYQFLRNSSIIFFTLSLHRKFSLLDIGGRKKGNKESKRKVLFLPGAQNYSSQNVRNGGTLNSKWSMLSSKTKNLCWTLEWSPTGIRDVSKIAWELSDVPVYKIEHSLFVSFPTRPN